MGETWLSDPVRHITVTGPSGEIREVDCNQKYQQSQKLETYIYGLIQRRALPTRLSKPRTSLVHDASVISWVKQSNLGCKEEQHSLISRTSHCLDENVPKAHNNLKQEHLLEIGFTEDGPPPYHHLHQSVQDHPRFYHKPKQPSMMDTSHLTLLDYPSFRVLQDHPDASKSEPDSPQHFRNYILPSTQSNPSQPPFPDEHLVSAEYIPAQPCGSSSRACTHHHCNPHNGSGMPSSNPITFSTERGHHHHQDQQPTSSQIQSTRCRGGPKEDRSGANRKLGKKANKYQSENSLPKVPDRKYNTVERDGGGNGNGGRGSHSNQSRSKKQQQGNGSYRRWQSTLELSQDETDQPPTHVPMQGSSTNQRGHYTRRTRKSCAAHAALYGYPHHHNSPHHHHMEYQLERDQLSLHQPNDDFPHPRQGESESSVSDADSPDSSSLSSDSDESGVLVWPQQLPPQLSLPSPPAPPGAPLQPKAFVKIKASHALKKKILRFRTGSLKVMTTV